MSDPLKQYIDSNRSDFEVFPFDEEAGWEEIAARVQVKSKSRFFKPWMYVAASVLLVGIFGIAVLKSGNQTSPYSAEVMEAKNYYQQMVDSKILLVKERVNDQELFRDLEAMDAAFAELENDLKDDVDNEEVVAAMIDNYRLKLRILEKILEELDQEMDDEVEHKNI